MAHVILHVLDKNGNNPKKCLINADDLVYVNEDESGKNYHWANIRTVDRMINWRIIESSVEVDELIKESDYIIQLDE